MNQAEIISEYQRSFPVYAASCLKVKAGCLAPLALNAAQIFFTARRSVSR